MPGDAPQNVPAVNLNCEDSSNVKLCRRIAGYVTKTIRN